MKKKFVAFVTVCVMCFTYMGIMPESVINKISPFINVSGETAGYSISEEINSEISECLISADRDIVGNVGDNVKINFYADTQGNYINAFEATPIFDTNALRIVDYECGYGFEASPVINVESLAYMIASTNGIINDPSQPYLTITFEILEGAVPGAIYEIDIQGLNGTLSPGILGVVDNKLTSLTPVITKGSIIIGEIDNEDIKYAVVNSKDAEEIVEALNFNVNDYLSNIKIPKTEISGPEYEIMGHNFCPIKFDVATSLEFKKGNSSVSVDPETKTIKVMTGIKRSGSADITQVGDMTNAQWSKQYNDIKSMYKSLTGSNLGTGNKNGTYWNQFQKMKGQLNRMKCDLFIKGSFSAAGYMEFSYETGKVVFCEGGIIQEASLGASFKYPITANFVYLTFGLEGTEKGVIKATMNENSKMALEYALSLSLKAYANVTGEIPSILKVECGIDSTISATISNGVEPLVVWLSGNVHLTCTALKVYEFFSETYPYLDYQLYPKSNNSENTGNGDGSSAGGRSISRNSVPTFASSYNSHNVILEKDLLENAEEITRDYLHAPSLMSNEISEYLFEQNGVYPYNDVKLLNLDSQMKMLIWLADDGTKSSLNRTSLVYSIYDGKNWSKVSPICNDEYLIGEFDVYNVNDNVYVVYQKASEVFEDGTEIDEMVKNIDICYSKFDGYSWNDIGPISDINGLYKGTPKIKYNSDGGYSCDEYMWSSNSENDLFMESGKNQLFFKDTNNMTYSVVETTDKIKEYCIGDYADECYYIISNENSDTLYRFYILDGETYTEEICTGSSISNLRTIDGESEIWYLKDGIVICDETETGISGIDNFTIVGNKQNKAILTKISFNVSSELYISNYENGLWSDFKPYSDFGKYIRNYNSVMNADGTVSTVYNLIDITEGENGRELTDSASIVVAEKCENNDIAVGYVYYDEENVGPGKTIEFTFDVNNMSDTALESVHIKMTDSSGNICTEQDLSCDVHAWSSGEITFSYTLPDEMEFSEYELTVTADIMEEDLSNNIVSTQIGFADLSIEDAEIYISDDGTAKVSGRIVNNGYSLTKNTVIRYYNQDDVENEISSEYIGTINPGEEKSFEFELPEDMLVTDEYYMLNSISMITESDTAELDYSNNEDKIILTDTFTSKPVNGDVNDDGVISIADVILIQKALVKANVNVDFSKVDINNDGKFNVFDLIIVKRMVLKN